MPKLIFRPPVVTIDRKHRQLTLWQIRRLKGYWPAFAWPVTIGMKGHETPTGLYFVEWKTKTPDWKAPDSDWVLPPKVPGHVYEFDDPLNPFAGGFISFSSRDGVGIHGTKFPPETGTAASHGCVRMEVESLLKLYKRLPLGAPVFVY
jgi:lipoprotein-anchoring transpeptidase ErfK/SrfK